MFDLDGVIFLGSTTLPQAGDALGAIQEAGSTVVFATNNATKTVDAIAERISRGTGFTPAVGSIVTSATATAAALDATAGPVFIVGEQGLHDTLEAAGFDATDDHTQAAAVVVGLDREIGYDKLDHAARAVRRGARFIATNTDATFPTPEGPAPGAGTIVAAIATASGVAPEVTGKPHPAMVRQVRTALSPGNTWMVGDRPETDLALARVGGWYSVLTLSGVTTSVDQVPAHLRPDIAVADIGGLFEIFAQ